MVTRVEAEHSARQLGLLSLDRYGGEHQLRQTQEEAAELICAASKLLRLHRRSGLPDGAYATSDELSALAKETADVYIMLEQVRILLGDDTINRAIDLKVRNRLAYLRETETTP